MTLIYQLLFNYYKQFLVATGAIITYFLFRKSEKLKSENKELLVESSKKDNTIVVQQEVIKSVKKAKTTNIDGTVKRMLNKEL